MRSSFQGAGKNILIGGIAQPIVANVDGIMTTLTQPLGQDRGQRVVDQKSHGTVRGSARSRTASAA